MGNVVVAVDLDGRDGTARRTTRALLAVAAGLGTPDSRTVVAIDTDPNAPLLTLADLGVVGDATRILPALLAEIDRRRGH